MEEIIPHEIIYKYSFSTAIKEGYICDYLIYLPFVENNKVIMEQPEELLTLDEDICKKCLFLINGLLRTGCIFLHFVPENNRKLTINLQFTT